MRVVIESDGVFMTIPDWFCSQEHITSKTAEIIRESKMAVLLHIGDIEKWVPKSVFTTHKIPLGLWAWGVD